jgi:hypothetical protein
LSQPSEIVHETPISTEDVAQAVDYLLSKQEALSSNPPTLQQKHTGGAVKQQRGTTII